ncbi:MAG TPA: hypothetical protein VN682_21395 [Terriglobales bacterium]|nr:hypothetical protein [Terriglobales bacterium]
MAGKRTWWKAVLIPAFFLLIVSLWRLNEYVEVTPEPPASINRV